MQTSNNEGKKVLLRVSNLKQYFPLKKKGMFVKANDGITLDIYEGETFGLVGESGCGKSTFLKLLLRFWQKQGGEILYNGADIDAIETASLLDNVTMVSQTTYLFDETIEENLRIARPGAARAEIEAFFNA